LHSVEAISNLRGVVAIDLDSEAPLAELLERVALGLIPHLAVMVLVEKRLGGGAVLVSSDEYFDGDENWGFPHLFPGGEV
jgi:hypothetical protein